MPVSTVHALVREIEKSRLRELPRDVENVADDPSLHNPLQRQKRLSTGWMGVSTCLQIAVTGLFRYPTAAFPQILL